MSEVFEGYERQYCELSANLSKKCTAGTAVDGGNKSLKKEMHLLFLFVFLFFLWVIGFGKPNVKKCIWVFHPKKKRVVFGVYFYYYFSFRIGGMHHEFECFIFLV